MYTASALLMRAMLGLEVELITGFMPGGGSGLSPPAPVPALENLSSSEFVSLIFFWSAGVKRNKAKVQQQHEESVLRGVSMHVDMSAFMRC